MKNLKLFCKVAFAKNRCNKVFILLACFTLCLSGCSSSDDSNDINNDAQPIPGGATVSAVTISDSGLSTATFEAAVTSEGSSAVSLKGFVYGTSPQPTLQDSKTDNGFGEGSFSASITGLTAASTYYVRAYAVNQSGTAYGPQNQFTTTTVAVAPTVTTISSAEVKQISAKATGKLINAGGASITELGICFIEDLGTNPTPTIDDRKMPATVTSGEFTVSVYGEDADSFWLKPQTTYKYRAYATNAQGTTSYGDVKEFTTANFKITGPTCTDASGNTYTTVILADRVWTAENMRTTIFQQNSMALSYRSSGSNWFNSIGSTPNRYTYPGGAQANVSSHGLLYNGYAVFNPNGLLPIQSAAQTNWRIPTLADWEILIKYLGGTNQAGKKLKKSGAWANDGNNADNTSGFNAIASGSISGTGSLGNFGQATFFWVNDSQSFKSIALAAGSSSTTVFSDNLTTQVGISVRCVRDY